MIILQFTLNTKTNQLQNKGRLARASDKIACVKAKGGRKIAKIDAMTKKKHLVSSVLLDVV